MQICLTQCFLNLFLGHIFTEQNIVSRCENRFYFSKEMLLGCFIKYSRKLEKSGYSFFQVSRTSWMPLNKGVIINLKL